MARAAFWLRACIRPHRVHGLRSTHRPPAAHSHHRETSNAAKMVLLRHLFAPAQSVHRLSVESHAASIAASRPRLPTVPTNQLSGTLTGHQVGVRQRLAPVGLHCDPRSPPYAASKPSSQHPLCLATHRGYSQGRTAPMIHMAPLFFCRHVPRSQRSSPHPVPRLGSPPEEPGPPAQHPALAAAAAGRCAGGHTPAAVQERG